jgi:hypothetical protein
MKPNVWASLAFSVLVGVVMCVYLVKTSGAVDLWVIALLGLIAAPWFWMAIEKVAFPGGSIVFRELKEKQEHQQGEIRALQFLVANFLTSRQYDFLSKFAEEGPVHISDDDDNARRFETLGQLRTLGFITAKGDWNEFATINWDGNLKDLFGITELGREYLELRANTNSPA